MSSLRRRLLSGGGGTLVLNATSRLLSIFTVVLLGRMLGTTGYGAYSFAIAVVSLLALPVQIGLPQLVTRLVVVYRHSADWGSFRGLLVRSSQLVTLMSITAGVVALALSSTGLGNASAFREPLLWALMLLPLLGLMAVCTAALRGLGRVALGQIPEQLVRPGLLLAALSAVWVWSPHTTRPSDAVKLNVLATAVAFSLGTWMLLKLTPHAAKATAAIYRNRDWMKAALPFLVLAGAELTLSYTDTIMLGLLASPSDVGVYRVADQGAALIAFALVAINVAAGPEYARLQHTGDFRTMRHLTILVARFALLWGLPLFVVYWIFGDWLLANIFGSEFSRGHVALLLLSVGQLINAAFGSVGVMLNMTGHASYTALGLGIAAAVNVILDLVLIPLLGVEGAAIASAIALVVWNVLLAWFVYRLLGFTSLFCVRA